MDTRGWTDAMKTHARQWAEWVMGKMFSQLDVDLWELSFPKETKQSQFYIWENKRFPTLEAALAYCEASK